MSTFQIIKARVSSEMKRGDLSASSSAVQAAVLSAIDRLKRKRFVFNEFNDANLTASASATYVTLGRLVTDSGIKPYIIDSIKAVIGSRDYPLTKRSWHEIDSIDSGQFYGYPEWYAIHAEKIRLYPPPNSEYVLRLSGLKELTEISASATAQATNAWVTDGEEMVRCLAKSFLFRDELRNPQSAQYFEGEAMKAMRELGRETRAKISSNRIRPYY